MTARPKVLFAMVAVAAVSGFEASHAQTPTLVVEASSGRVLHAELATDPWFPASITKLMTTYVALDQVRQRKLRMDSLLTMSEQAAAAPPSKIGLRPGLTLTLENALKIIMVKSANDVANMIGENLGGGSVEGFAALMNQASRRLGMNESRWYNPSGLPDPRQQTSARDMAILARALLTEFPDNQDLFNIGAIQLGSMVMKNHNGLIGRYPGADGMKTGFICSGGFNVVSSASRGGRRLITVVMGYPSARERDLKAADLFDANFSSGGWGNQSLASLSPSSQVSAPDMRQTVCGPKRKQPGEEDDNSLASSGFNAGNPITSLFSASSLGGSFGTIGPSGRRILGPRVAFAPVPIWVGAQPGGNDDEALMRGRGRTRIAKGRRVPTTVISRAGAPTPAAVAFSSAPTQQIMSGQTLDIVKTTKRNPSRAAIAVSIDPKPTLGAKPKAAAVTPKAKPAVAGVNPGAKSVQPKSAQTKPAQAAKPAQATAKKSASAKE